MPRIVDIEPVLKKLEDAMADTDGAVRSTIAALIHLLRLQPIIGAEPVPVPKEMQEEVPKKCSRCCFRFICCRDPRKPSSCRDYVYDPTTERRMEHEQKKSSKKKTSGTDPRDRGHELSSDHGGNGRRTEGAGAGRGQADADKPSHDEGDAAGVRKDAPNRPGRPKKKPSFIRGRVRVTKEIEALFPECRPPKGAEYDAEIYLAEQGRYRERPYCIVEHAGKRIVLRTGEYEEIRQE